jgi:hypothetical protein
MACKYEAIASLLQQPSTSIAQASLAHIHVSSLHHQCCIHLVAVLNGVGHKGKKSSSHAAMATWLCSQKNALIQQEAMA